MTCKRSKQCDHADLCRFAQSDDYNLLGGSCFEPKDPQTNEEWLHTMNAEQLAEFLVMIQMSVMHPVKRGAVDMEKFTEEVVEWLKQPHTKE